MNAQLGTDEGNMQTMCSERYQICKFKQASSNQYKMKASCSRLENIPSCSVRAGVIANDIGSSITDLTKPMAPIVINPTQLQLYKGGLAHYNARSFWGV
jgi:hypothetical protein